MAKINWNAKQKTTRLDIQLKDVKYFTLILLYMSLSEQFLQNKRQDLQEAILHFERKGLLKKSGNKTLYRFTAVSDVKYANFIAAGNTVLDKFNCYSFTADKDIAEHFIPFRSDTGKLSGLYFQAKVGGYHLYSFTSKVLPQMAIKLCDIVESNGLVKNKDALLRTFQRKDYSILAANFLSTVEKYFSSRVAPAISVTQYNDFYDDDEKEYIVFAPIKLKFSNVIDFSPSVKLTEFMLKNQDALQTLLEQSNNLNVEKGYSLIKELSKTYKIDIVKPKEYFRLDVNKIDITLKIASVSLLKVEANATTYKIKAFNMKNEKIKKLIATYK